MIMKIITTDYEKHKFWQEKECDVKPVGCMNLVKPFPAHKRQQIRGFGGAFTEASGYCYSKLSAEKKAEFIQAYFGENGLRYNLGRTHINSCDFSLENYDAVPAEFAGQAEETASDAGQAPAMVPSLDLGRANQYVLPLIQDAQKVCGGQEREGIEFLLSPWSPPAFMKTNGEMNHGGRLKDEYRGVWADYIAKYLLALQAEGLKIGYLTVQNEPEAVQTWDSCIYHAEEEKVFARDFLRPALDQAGLGDIKILVWDHNKEIAYERADAIFSDEAAAQAVYGLAVHWYTGDHFESLSLVREAYPDKEIFFTEGCVEYSRFMDSNETAKAEMYAHDMIGNLSHGVSAFFDWNLMLDAEGGPNHVGNFCAAPVMASADEKDFERRLSYYYIGHFSRYIQKGACAVPVTAYSSDVEVCGFVNPSGERVLVLLNRRDTEQAVTIGEQEKGTDLVLAPHTITTVCYQAEEIEK